MKEDKICCNSAKTREIELPVPFISNLSALAAGQNKNNVPIKDGGSATRRRKSMPKKSITHKNSLPCNNPGYSDYKMLKLRETYRQRQVDFVEGRCRGMRLLVTNLQPSKQFK